MDWKSDELNEQDKICLENTIIRLKVGNIKNSYISSLSGDIIIYGHLKVITDFSVCIIVNLSWVCMMEHQVAYKKEAIFNSSLITIWDMPNTNEVNEKVKNRYPWVFYIIGRVTVLLVVIRLREDFFYKQICLFVNNIFNYPYYIF